MEQAAHLPQLAEATHRQALRRQVGSEQIGTGQFGKSEDFLLRQRPLGERAEILPRVSQGLCFRIRVDGGSLPAYCTCM